jgi:hypothetical protein
MESELSEAMTWAAGMAARLKILQADASNLAKGERQGFMKEELERALADVPQPRRRACLQALADHFPAWQVAAVASETTTSAPDLKADTPELRLEALLRTADGLTAEQRREFAVKLKAAGFAVVESVGSIQPTADLSRALGGDVDRIDAERAVKLIILNCTLALSLDEMVSKVWRELAPKSPKAKKNVAGELKTLMRRYLAGDSEVSLTELNKQTEQLRRLTAGLLWAMGGAGRPFSMEFREHLSPDAIESLARMEISMFKSMEQVCWKKYRELFEVYASEAKIDDILKKSVVNYADQVMQGGAAGG